MSTFWQPRSLIATFGICAAALAYLVAVFLPMQRQLLLIQRSIASDQQMIREREEDIREIAEIERELRQATTFVSQARSATPKSQAVGTVLARLSRVAAESGLVIETVEPRPSVSGRRLQRLRAMLSGRGSYPQFVTFLRAAESEDCIIWIEQANLEKAGDSSEVMQFELTLGVFAESDEFSNHAGSADRR